MPTWNIPAPPKPAQASGDLDIDLTDVLAELEGITNQPKPKPAPAPPAPQASLDEAFKDFRSEVSKQTGTHQAKEQLTRDPRPFPTLKLAPRTDLFGFEYEDFTLEGYDAHPSIKAPIAV